MFSCGRSVPWSEPLDLFHPVNPERSECIDDYCREFIGFRKVEDAGELRLGMMASSKMTFELLDDSGKVIAQATPIDNDRKQASPLQERLEYQLNVRGLQKGRYILKVSGPPGAYQVWGARADMSKK